MSLFPTKNAPILTTSGHDMSDADLASRVCSGDHEAFGILTARHTPRLLSICIRMMRSPVDAEDVVQDTFLKFWRNPMLWNPDKGAAFGTWIYQVAVNACIDDIRCRKRYSTELPSEEKLSADIKDGPEHKIFTNEQEMRAAWMRLAIDRLPERQHTALLLCFYEEMSNKQAADIMAISVKALESLLIRGKNTLREQAAALQRKGGLR